MKGKLYLYNFDELRFVWATKLSNIRQVTTQCTIERLNAEFGKTSSNIALIKQIQADDVIELEVISDYVVRIKAFRKHVKAGQVQITVISQDESDFVQVGSDFVALRFLGDQDVEVVN